MTDIIKIEPEESGLQPGHLTEDRVEALAEYWRTPEKERDSVLAFAKTWGLSALKVREARSDKRILAKVKESVEVEATYASYEAIGLLRELMRDPRNRDRLKAGRTAFEITKLLSNQPVLQNVNQSFHSTEFESLSDAEIRDQIGRVAAEEGWIRPKD